jgi:hypothetical protein
MRRPHRFRRPPTAAVLLALLCAPAVATADPDIRIAPLTLSFPQQARRPIFVEIDWMEDGTHTHKPSQAVIDRIVQTFANAGYSITIDVSNAIPHQTPLAVGDSVEDSPAVQAIMAQYFNHAGDNRYYYSIWGHNYSLNGSFTTSSGIADLPGRVHLVTLGSFGGQTGTFSNQVGTFIHEFGHNLGQKHGGVDHGNYKPNYLSVMNYHYQLSGVGPSLLALRFASSAAGFDDFSYSHGLSPTLNENNLDENLGVGLARAVDWSCDGQIQTGVAKDIQNSNYCAAFSTLSVLTDFDNWSNLSSQIRTARSAARPPTSRAVPCITPEENRPLQERIDQLRAAGLLPPDGPSPRLPVLTSGEAGRSFLIFNDGNTLLTVDSLSLDTATSWIHWAPQAPFTVAPGKSQEVLVYVDLGQIPAGQTVRRLLVQSNDADETPYPGGVNLVITAAGPSQPLSFYTVTPCRVFDTRTSAPLTSGTIRTFTIAGACGIPVTAKAVSANVTVTGPTATGEVNLWPADFSNPATNALSFRAGVTRANNGVVELAIGGTGDVAAQAFLNGGGTVHLILDVNGYFQ